MTPALRFSSVSKVYRTGGTRYGSFRESVMSRLRPHRPSGETEEHWAVRDLTIDIQSGECVGIVGPNGAGKSTILKLASRITRPTSGRVIVNGSIASLIEVGAGFHPELTGRENLLLYGAILGMTRNAIRRKQDAIVAYAELERFLDVPLKRYSSGMHIRLGFAIAIHSDADILLMDEVLAVGDIAFQQRCLETVRALRESGRTIVLVSHNMRAVESMCRRIVWLDQGTVCQDGAPGSIIPAYMQAYLGSGSKAAAYRPGIGGKSRGAPVTLLGAQLLDAAGKETRELRTGDSLVVRVPFLARERVPCPHFAINLYSLSGDLLATASMVIDGSAPESIAGAGILECTFTSLPLLPNEYVVAVGAADATGVGTLVEMQRLADFKITDVRPELLKLDGPAARSALLRDGGVVHCPYRWKVIRPAAG